MAGDGVSLPTTIANLGTVAKTQAKGQQAAQPTTPFAEQMDKNDDLKVQRVKETEQAAKKKIDPDAENTDKRKRRRRRRNRKLIEAQERESNRDQTETDADQDEPVEESIGCLIDLRV